MVEETRADRAVGYGLFGFAIGLVLFALTYIATTRADIANPTDGTWLLIFFALLLGPAVIAAFIGAGRPSGDAARP